MALFLTYILKAEKTTGICDNLLNYDLDCYLNADFITLVGHSS